MLNLTNVMNKEVNVQSVTGFLGKITAIAERTFENEAVKKIFEDPKETFDVVIAEWMFNNIYSSIAAIYKCPFIWLSSVEPHWRILELIDELPNPSYNPDAISVNNPPFSFLQRFEELSYQIAGFLINYFYISSFDNQNYDKYIVPVIRKRGNPVPTFKELWYNASLILGNSHVSIGRATRLPPNYKSIGGYHISSETKPLPADLKKLMDDAKHGVIYFSMGSNLKSKMLPDELKQNLLKMFGSLKQTVLWKFEDALPNRPSNVHILQWAPQQSILAHPKCRLFITHGGLLSTTETIYFGKPVIVIPVFADQFGNADRAVRKGFAKRIDLSYTMAGDIKEAIEEMFRDPIYATRAKELSLIFHDRPITPGKEVVHWVEHVIKTKGAPHLRSPALDMPCYQKYYLDLLAIIIVILYLIVKVIKIVLYKIFGQKQVKVLDRKKRN